MGMLDYAAGLEFPRHLGKRVMNNDATVGKPPTVDGLLAKGPPGQGGESSFPAQAFVAQIQKLNSGWRVGLAEMQKRDAEFAFRLAHSSSPSDAMQVCAEWMSRRVGSVLDMQKQFFDLWGRYASDLPLANSPDTDPPNEKIQETCADGQ
jgi:hypothetical protein